MNERMNEYVDPSSTVLTMVITGSITMQTITTPAPPPPPLPITTTITATMIGRCRNHHH